MKRVVLIIMAIALMFLLGCGTKKDMSDTQRDAVRLEVESLMKELLADAEKLQTGLMEQYLSDNPQDSFYMDAQAFSKADLIAEAQKAYKDFQSQKIEILKQHTYVLSPVSAVWKAELRSDAINLDGETESTFITETWLWQKQDGDWLVLHFDENW